MSTDNTSGFLTLQAAAALNEYIRVKCDANGKADVASTTDVAIGVTMHKAASGDYVTVKLFTAPGTFLMTAGGAITRGSQVYPTTAGKILATGTTQLGIVNKEAAAADGDIIECIVGVQKGA
jgi:hypothetical protein